jgi:hypothetical protein
MESAMRKMRAGLVVVGVLGALLLMPGAAQAQIPLVGVNGCNASSSGDYVAGQCQSITTPGYYYLSIHNFSGGFASAEVSCTQGGSFSTNDYGYGYLNGGLCTVFFYSEYSGSVDLAPF